MFHLTRPIQFLSLPHRNKWFSICTSQYVNEIPVFHIHEFLNTSQPSNFSLAKNDEILDS